MVAAQLVHIVLSRRVDVERTDTVGGEAGAQQSDARVGDVVLQLEVACNNRGHLVLLNCQLWH
jgi:hypothetical protein